MPPPLPAVKPSASRPCALSKGLRRGRGRGGAGGSGGEESGMRAAVLLLLGGVHTGCTMHTLRVAVSLCDGGAEVAPLAMLSVGVVCCL